MLVNAATGSPKNIAPWRLIATSKSVEERIDLRIGLLEEYVSQLLASGALTGQLDHACRQIHPQRRAGRGGPGGVAGRLSRATADIEHARGVFDRRGGEETRAVTDHAPGVRTGDPRPEPRQVPRR